MSDKDWYDEQEDYNDEKEIEMTVDYTKPVFTIHDTSRTDSVHETYEAAVKAAAAAAKRDHNGDDFLVLKSVARVSVPVAEHTLTEITG
jgi:hypothetical protein